MRIVFPVLEESAEVVYQKLHRRMKRAVDTAEDGEAAVRGPRGRREVDVDTESGKMEKRDRSFLNLVARRGGESLA